MELAVPAIVIVLALLVSFMVIKSGGEKHQHAYTIRRDDGWHCGACDHLRSEPRGR